MKISNIGLVITNVAVLYLAIARNWNTQEILLTYWLQSVIIGIFQFIKIVDLQQFSTEGFKINGQPVSPTNYTKFFTAFFFAAHYGFFHLVYLISILEASNLHNVPIVNINIKTDFLSYNSSDLRPSHPLSFSSLALVALIFFVNHLVSFFVNRQQDRNSNKNIGKLMFAPYIRIIPMHLTLIFGFMLGLPKLFFLTIRGATDYYAHLMEHRSAKPILEANEESYVQKSSSTLS